MTPLLMKRPTTLDLSQFEGSGTLRIVLINSLAVRMNSSSNPSYFGPNLDITQSVRDDMGS